MAKATGLSKEDILEAIKEMSVLDLSELVKSLEETFGVSAAAPVAVAAAGPATGADPSAGASEEDQSEFKVTLQDIGPNKIYVINSYNQKKLINKKSKSIVNGETIFVQTKEDFNLWNKFVEMLGPMGQLATLIAVLQSASD